MNWLCEIVSAILKLFGGKGLDCGNGNGNGEPCYTEEEARQIVHDLYFKVLDREPDEEAQGYVDSLIDCSVTPADVEKSLRESDEHRRNSEMLIRNIFTDMLYRDPGPPEPEGEWITGGSGSPADNGALGYVDDYQWGRKTEEQIRAEIKESDEYKEKHKFQASRAAVVVNRWLREPQEPARNTLPLSISLFYALALGLDRGYYETVINNLAGKVSEARFNMSTLGWGKEGEQRAPAVIPWLPGDMLDGYGNKVNPAFLDEMEHRLDYAVSRGVRPQLTLFWGGFQALFVKHKGMKTFHENAMKDYLRKTCERLKNHPAVNVELMNEINHGAHCHFLGLPGRKEFIQQWGTFIKGILPNHLLSVSDGGNQPNDDGNYFYYHSVPVLDHWNVHFPRDEVSVEGFPRWARGVWHLNGEFHAFHQKHPGKGYGRNDENMFLQTPADHAEWPYRQSTRDWKMYGSQIFVSLCAGAPTTIHNQSGFLLGQSKAQGNRPDFPNTEPIFKVAKFYQDVTRDFPWQGMTPYNAGWGGSPVREFDNSFKAFSLVGQQWKSIIVTVLSPKGSLTMNLKDGKYKFTVYEITGETKKSGKMESGKLQLPAMNYKKCAVIRFDEI